MLPSRSNASGNNPPSTITNRDLILFVLLALRKTGEARVREHFLHKVLHNISKWTGTLYFRFATNPIVYSGELYNCLRSLERDRVLDELIFVHDGWAPQHVYELTTIGVVEAEDRFERAERRSELTSELASVLSHPNLLVAENKEENSRKPS